MGFFTDACDLNVISTALLLITPQFHLTPARSVWSAPSR
jgi:hypothetical protein